MLKYYIINEDGTMDNARFYEVTSRMTKGQIHGLLLALIKPALSLADDACELDEEGKSLPAFMQKDDDVRKVFEIAEL